MSDLGSIVLGDWGTSRLRLYRVHADRPRNRLDGPGIGALGVAPADALKAALQPWLEGERPPVYLCGMAGSRNGLAEVAYLELPAAPAEWARRAHTLHLATLAIHIAPGLKRQAEGIPDVMRGEETQIFGALELEPALATGRHLIVLPGTHSKWVRVEDARITAFTTYITGELYALLASASTLLRTATPVVVAPHGGENPATAADGLPAGFDAGLARSRDVQGLSATLFETRSRQLIDGQSADWAANFLSGVLIGAEIKGALDAARAVPHKAPPNHAAPPFTSVRLIGDPSLTRRYRHALELAGVNAEARDGDECAIAGLSLLARLRSRRISA